MEMRRKVLVIIVKLLEKMVNDCYQKGCLYSHPKKLLNLFEDIDGKCSVDGTLKAFPVLWKKLFI